MNRRCEEGPCVWGGDLDDSGEQSGSSDEVLLILVAPCSKMSTTLDLSSL